MMIIYNVKKGDTLWSIASKFDVTTSDIIDINGIDNPRELVIGMSLVIPSNGLYHTVNPGESLWYISNLYNSDIHKIISINNLDDNGIIYPGDKLIIPTKYSTIRKTPLETLGYYDSSKKMETIGMIDDIGPYLTYLGLFEFPVTSDGQIKGVVDQDILAASIKNRAALLPVLTNILDGNFDPDLAREVISNPESRQNLINNTVDLLNKYDLEGVIIDFENLYPEDRDIFSFFIQELYTNLNNNGKMLILNVAPKWEDWPDKDWVGFFDFNAIGDYIDRAAIMTYEWGWRTGPPRPTAPIEFVERALLYAEENNIPVDKLLLGLTLYGYDWPLPYQPQNVAKTLSLPKVWDTAYANNADIVFMDDVKQPKVDYTDSNTNTKHKIWFENALSHLYKYDLSKKKALRGVFYWIINLEFPSTWYMVNELFDIVKIIEP